MYSNTLDARIVQKPSFRQASFAHGAEHAHLEHLPYSCTTTVSASIGEHSVGTTAELAHESVARKLAWGDYSDITSELGESAQFHPTITDKLFLEAGQRVTQRKELCTKARLRDQAQLRGFKMPESSLRILVNKLRKDLHKCLESMEIPPAALLTKRQLTHVLQALRLFRPRDAHSHPKYKDCLEDKLLTKLFDALAVRSMTSEQTGMDVTTVFHFLCAAVELSVVGSGGKENGVASKIPSSNGSQCDEDAVLNDDVDVNLQELAVAFSRRISMNHLVHSTLRRSKISAEAPPFKPQLSDRTRLMAESRRAVSRASRATLHAAGIEAVPSGNMLGKDPRTIQKVEEARLEQIEKEMAACTFSPQIRPLPGVAKKEKVVQTNKHDIKDVSDDGETAECSFSPQVNRTSSMSNSLNLAKSLCSHPGEQKCVQRMRKAQRERERIQKALDIRHTLPSSNADRRSQDKHPLKLSPKAVLKKHPIMYLDVQLTGGCSGRIEVCRDDDHSALAANFARAYHLHLDDREQIEQLIRSQLFAMQTYMASNSAVARYVDKV